MSIQVTFQRVNVVQQQTVSPLYGSFQMDDNDVATDLTQNTWTKIAGETTPCECLGFTHADDNELEYVPPDGEPRVMRAMVSLSMEPAAGTPTVEVSLFKDGEIVPTSTMTMTLANNRQNTMTVNKFVSMAAGEVFSVYMRNLTGDQHVTVHNLSFTIR
jgi:hypothetical protein